MQHLSALVLLLLTLTFPAQAQDKIDSVLTVQFPTVAEGRRILTEGSEAGYFENLQLAEMRAKTGLTLEGGKLADARAKARAKYADDVQAFSSDEAAMLRDVLRRLAPRISQDFPLMARTPFSFVKTGVAVEGGVPHTRAGSIILSSAELGSMTRMYRWGWTTILDQMAAPLLIHEQTHVLQRLYPERFNQLYTELLGFRRLDKLPDHPWLAERRVSNPDALDLRWAYRMGEGSPWMVLELLLSELEHPKLADDSHYVAVKLLETDAGFRLMLNEKGLPMTQELKSLSGYQARFPNKTENYHPNEIAADLISGWVTGMPEGNAKHPLRAKIGDWVRAHLQ
ncbi:hypothetical protein [Paucibacter soli]|uniref:hypothetical protein n=1 Tax=Paucibacter soli TaxID=3133433 RepID=UPI0030B28E63